MNVKLKCSFLVFLLILQISSIYSQEQDQEYEEQSSAPEDLSMQYVVDYQNAVSSMFPTQSFSFEIQAGHQQKISLWPPGDTQKVIFAFYTHNEESPQMVTGEGFSVQCELNGQVVKQFPNKKVGACTFDLVNRANIINIKFKSQETALSVYVSYEYKKMSIQTRSTIGSDNLQTKQDDKKKKLDEVSRKFDLVEKSTENQETALRMVVKGLSKHSKRVEKNVDNAYQLVIIETLIVIISGTVGMWMMKKQLTKGYELLV